MAVMETRCLYSQIGTVHAEAEGEDAGAVRLQLTSMLRCASQLDCKQAVACSDESMVLLRQLVLKRHPS
jgi:hypothetical protein